MANSDLKIAARQMRSHGASINAIVKTLSVSKSTASHWCKDIALTRTQIERLTANSIRGGARGRLKAAEKKRADRVQRTILAERAGQTDVSPQTSDFLFALGLGLYWGEGYKSDNGECGLTNSDPGIIRYFIQWLRKAYGIQSRDLILRVSLNDAHRERVTAVERYWSDIIQIPLSQFTKTSLIHAHTKKKYRDPELHYGTLRVKVRRATQLRRRILGSIKELRKRV